MKHFTLLLVGITIVVGGFAQTQTAADALNNDKQTLRERYLLMKTKSQNYEGYKVIKEPILDGVFKIFFDSVAAKQAAFAKSQTEIRNLQAELTKSMAALKAKEDSMEDIVHASTHITVLGIDFDKGFFAGMFGVILLIAGLVVAAIVYMMKVLRKNLTEKEELAKSISTEYEEYKRKAMDKQTKLSRELQNERNKLQELGAL
jgi:Skp family chaperone for outer membrane proteins